LVILDIGLSWIYVEVLTNPGCRTPKTIPNIAPPNEYTLQTEDGLNIKAWYYPSKNGAAILSMGGLGGSLGDRSPPVGFLIKAGYGVLQMDSRACAKPSSRVTLGAKEVLDARAGLKFLLSRPETDPNRIGAYGFSMGGVTIIRTAALEPQIVALLPEGGYTNLGDLFVDPGVSKPLPISIFRHTVAAVFSLRTGQNPWLISPIDDLSSIYPRPILFIYGENEVENGWAYEKFSADQESISIWVVPGGSHGQNHIVNRREYEHRVIEFFEGTIGSRRED
jgi:fermentation-respiration switch protein FrsA (DUF1100 family)